MHDYQKIAAIVGEDKINALREAGVNIADKPAKPATGLLGRWAKDKDGTDVLIIGDKAVSNGSILVAFFNEDGAAGAKIDNRCLEDLTFPEETTRPEDVPVGEAWLVNVDDRVDRAESVPAVKTHNGNWTTGAINDETWWTDKEVTLIAPLVPARPVDTDREHTLETVTTEEEYEALPEGSIVAKAGARPYVKFIGGIWKGAVNKHTNLDMAGVTRQVLWKGWGE